jgi:hypothetical protein
MDPVTAKVVVACVELIREAAKEDALSKRLDAIESALDRLARKADQLILREIKAAYEAIRVALTTDCDETREARLRFAEEHLLKNTSLDPSLETAGQPNAHWMALAHHGLALICARRDDQATAARHLLEMFVAAPREARRSLAPRLFTRCLKPRCGSAYRWHKKAVRQLQQQGFGGRTFLGKAKAAITLIGGGGAGVATRQLGVAQKAVAESGRQWAEATPEHYRALAREELDRELEARVDELCRRAARKLLATL